MYMKYLCNMNEGKKQAVLFVIYVLTYYTQNDCCVNTVSSVNVSNAEDANNDIYTKLRLPFLNELQYCAKALNHPSFFSIYLARKIGNRCSTLFKHVEAYMEIVFIRQKEKKILKSQYLV